MKQSESDQSCPQCGATLPTGALLGLCPACLLAQGAPTQPQAQGFEPLPVATVAKLFPNIEVLELIGKGGMGAVYKARQPVLDRLVALKLLPAQTSPNFAERFTREARALARLDHPNIVGIHDFGQVGDDLHYFLMEYVDGLNLRQIERSRKLSPAEALKIIPQICEALQYAHDEGIVHRDIKPENVLIDKKGRVKIADFGLAKILGNEAPGEHLTAAGQVMGTPHYMAPEQVERPAEVDHRADLYSLGVVFYEMLTGELPLGRFAPPSRKVALDVRLDDVVLRALEKEPELRYRSATEIKTRLDDISQTPAPKLQPPASPAPLAPTSKPQQRSMLLFAGVAILALFGLGIIYHAKPTPTKAQPPEVATTQSVDDFPPVVVQTDPPSGAESVEPGARELRVRFSKEMTDENWTWSTAWNDSAPEVLTPPKYLDDHKTCVLKVQLEPGRTYAYWLNSSKFHNFQDIAGQPAIPYLLIFRTRD